MQINVALAKNSHEQAAAIRQAYYPNTTANQTRDAFIFNVCIDQFAEAPEILREYLENDQQSETLQRMVTIKAESYSRLKSIAASLDASIASTYRSIIAYTVRKIAGCDVKPKADKAADSIKQILKENVSLLEAQLRECRKTLSALQALIAEI